MQCQADCFQDERGVIRPIASPKELVWTYYEVITPSGFKSGSGKRHEFFRLESREFHSCKCGCGQLIATPAINIQRITESIPDRFKDSPIEAIKLSKFAMIIAAFKLLLVTLRTIIRSK